MSIVFDPESFLRKTAPRRKIAKILSQKVTLKKAALSFLADVPGIDPKAVAKVALKTIKGYTKRINAETAEKSELLDDPKQLIQRVQNEVVFQMHDSIKENYGGKKGTWLPSSAEEPRPEHQLNYGKTYIIGVGINGVEPGDEPGCMCGVEIQTDETELNL